MKASGADLEGEEN